MLSSSGEYLAMVVRNATRPDLRSVLKRDGTFGTIKLSCTRRPALLSTSSYALTRESTLRRYTIYSPRTVSSTHSLRRKDVVLLERAQLNHLALDTASGSRAETSTTFTRSPPRVFEGCCLPLLFRMTRKLFDFNWKGRRESCDTWFRSSILMRSSAQLKYGMDEKLPGFRAERQLVNTTFYQVLQLVDSK